MFDIRPKAIVTMGVGSMQPVLDQTLPTFRWFAERHGYDIVIGTSPIDCSRPPAWWKIPLIRTALNSYSIVLWLDADTIILDDSKDPADFMHQDSYQAMVRHKSTNEICPNTGVWLLRKDAQSLAFLDAVWQNEQFVNDSWWENAAVIHLLGYSLRPTRPEHDSPFLLGTSWLGDEWNSHVGWNGIVPCQIRHYAGLSNKKRIRGMQIDLWSVQSRRLTGIRRWYRLGQCALGELSRQPRSAVYTVAKKFARLARWLLKKMCLIEIIIAITNLAGYLK